MKAEEAKRLKVPAAQDAWLVADQALVVAALWVVPNPSGLNAHETVASHAYAAPAIEADVLAAR